MARSALDLDPQEADGIAHGGVELGPKRCHETIEQRLAGAGRAGVIDVDDEEEEGSANLPSIEAGISEGGIHAFALQPAVNPCVEVVPRLLDALQVAYFQAVTGVRRGDALRAFDVQAIFGALQWD